MIQGAHGHNAYACRLYVHAREATRFLLVCEGRPFPAMRRPGDWELVVLGFDPPNRVKPWLKLNGHHQIWLDGTEPFGRSEDEPV